MKSNIDKIGTPRLRGVPNPSYVFNEFWHVIYVGFVATFAPGQAQAGKRVHSPVSEALHLKLVLNKNGKETVPLTLEVPSNAFEHAPLAERIADAIAAAVLSGRTIAASPERARSAN
jgi:hypothetical protein